MSKIEFKINGKRCFVDACTPRETTLNAYIRYVAALPGTKSMCLEGGCGACIVLVRARRYSTGNIETFSVNSCLVLVFSCSAWDIVTVEGLGSRVAGYSDVQRRIAAFSGTQCGYCTPGWVTHLTSLKDKNLTMAELEKLFGSNTCRCTGFRPILDTIKSFAVDATPRLRQKVKDIEDLQLCKKTNELCFKHCNIEENDFDCIADDYVKVVNTICIDFGASKFYKVYEENDIFVTWNKEGLDSYMLVDGNTSKGIYECFEYPRILIDISDVQALKSFKLDQNLVLGANVTLEDCIDIFKDAAKRHSEFSYLIEFVKHFELIAHVPVRKIGSLAGNLMLKHTNPFYQSDIFLLFECVGAAITIKNSNGKIRVMPLLDFLQYDMRGKLITAIELPPYSESHVFRSYKIMPRNQNALAIVNAAFLFKIGRSTGTIETASVVYGNIARNFTHACGTERALTGCTIYDNSTLQAALSILRAELQCEPRPPEPGPNTRAKLALGLFYKCFLSIVPPGSVYAPYQSGGSVFKRPVSKSKQDCQTDPELYPLNEPVVKLEALIQSAGEARYANDTPPAPRDVFAAFVLATTHSGEIDSIDVEHLQKIEGFLAIFTAKDIPGKNSFIFTGFQRLVEDEEILATKIKYYGQPVAIVVATSQQFATNIAKKVKITYKNVSNTPPVITIAEALKDSNRYVPFHRNIRPSGKGTNVTKVIKGVHNLDGQHHYYMELLTCVVVPVDKGLEVYDSSQWMEVTQMSVAQCLSMNESQVMVRVRRIGGGFGGKCTRSAQVAAACALVAKKIDRTCRFILPMQTNLTIAGTRFPCHCEYEIGINDEGKIQYLNASVVEDKGCANNDNVIQYVIDPFLNCYNTDFWKADFGVVNTDLPCNTYMRSSGCAEGISCIEHIMEHIAFAVNKDPIAVREINMTDKDKENLPSLIEHLKERTDYDKRAKDIEIFNKNNRWIKKAIKISVMSYPVFFYGNHSALVSIYRGDGTVTITSGGIEMGQGIHTKAAQVCAYELGIPLNYVSVLPCYSFSAANNVCTGASITSESICYSIIKACEILKERLKPIREKMPEASWVEIIEAAGKEDTLIELSAMYMMNEFDKNLSDYKAYGVAILEVELDVLTGRFQIDRVDILEDVGLSANPNIDVGQVEGGYIQGLGYYTSEKFVHEASTGRLLTNRSLTYHVPLATDIPVEFNVYLRYNSYNEKKPVKCESDSLTEASVPTLDCMCLSAETPYLRNDLRNLFTLLKSDVQSFFTFFSACGELGVGTAQGIQHALRHCIMESRKDSGYDMSKWIYIAVPYDTESILKALDTKIEEFLITQ